MTTQRSPNGVMGPSYIFSPKTEAVEVSGYAIVASISIYSAVNGTPGINSAVEGTPKLKPIS